MKQDFYHVTVLSNLPRAYDKYSGRYDKAHIAESSFPEQFFVLTQSQLAIGIQKAQKLLDKLHLPGNRLLVLCAQLDGSLLQPNLRTQLGSFLPGSSLPINAVYLLDQAQNLLPISIEEAMAQAFALHLPQMHDYAGLRPRTVSVLPVALACQAACRFCFSKASVSLDTELACPDLSHIQYWVQRAKEAGAERFVITGGGEPGLIQHAQLLALIQLGHAALDKTVLITNGVHLSRRAEPERSRMLRDYAQAGLSVLSLSRHHHADAINTQIMGLATHTDAVLASWRALPTSEKPAVRLICVLQQGGIANADDVAAYLDWAVAQGVRQFCFKELYVSTTEESAYHAMPANHWSRQQQVALSMLCECLQQHGFQISARLPWGAPIYNGQWRGHTLSIAAYTEPSLYWERSHGIARSWNIMASGQCLVSLEDPASVLAADADAPHALHAKRSIAIEVT